jgi:hypothetical protein
MLHSFLLCFEFDHGGALFMKKNLPESRDGFHVRESEYKLPEDDLTLDHQTKRAVAICNLFINHQYTIVDIVRSLDEPYGDVVLALLEQGMIRERRQRGGQAPGGIERRQRGQ